MKSQNRPDWARDLPDTFDQYAVHEEHVPYLPDGAVLLTSSETCEIGGFGLGSKLATTQNHPEMDRDFVEAIIEEFEDEFPSEVVESARSSVTVDFDRKSFAEAIARFFEQAAQ